MLVYGIAMHCLGRCTSMWSVVTLLIPGPNSSMSRAPSSVAQRVLLAVMGATAMFFAACYQSALLKYLLTDAHAIVYQDLNRLVERVADEDKQLVSA